MKLVVIAADLKLVITIILTCHECSIFREPVQLPNNQRRLQKKKKSPNVKYIFEGGGLSSKKKIACFSNYS